MNIFTKRLEKMGGVRFYEILHSKIVNSKSESGKTTLMAPEARSVFHGMVARFRKMYTKLFVGENSSFF